MLSRIFGPVLPPSREKLDTDLIDRDVITTQLHTSLLQSLDAVYADHNFLGEAELWRIQLLLDVAWEKLNTGCWKDVSLSWRLLYSYASLAKAVALLRVGKPEESLLACDMGLLMGAPVQGNLLAQLAQLCNQHCPSQDVITYDAHPKKKIKHCQAPLMKAEHCLSEVQCPSLENFLQEFARTEKPVVITGAIDHWPALSMRKWSVEQLVCRIGLRTVPVEIGAKYTDENWSQKLMTVKEFIKTFVIKREEGGPVGYLAQHQLFQQIPELLDDIEVPMYCYTADEEPDMNVWLGPGGTVSPLHYDPKDNFLTQVFGEKYVRLYPREATPFLYPHQDRLLHNTSQVDVENPNTTEFPLFKTACFQECILGPGQMLYIPAGCWHYIRSLSTSLSISFWWNAPRVTSDNP